MYEMLTTVGFVCLVLNIAMGWACEVPKKNIAYLSLVTIIATCVAGTLFIHVHNFML